MQGTSDNIYIYILRNSKQTNGQSDQSADLTYRVLVLPHQGKWFASIQMLSTVYVVQALSFSCISTTHATNTQSYTSMIRYLQVSRHFW